MFVILGRMLFLPALQQILVPGFFSFLLMVASLLPIQKEHTVHVIQQAQKKVEVAITPSVSPIPTKKQLSQKAAIPQGQIPTAVHPFSVTPSQYVAQLPTNSAGDITAQTTLSASGKTIHLAMSFPKNGGAIAGKILGDCTGSIAGSYTQSSSALSGSANANCPMGFFSIPVSLTYTGSLLSSSQASVHYTVRAMGQTDSGDTTLHLTE